jgi:biopolymer transport protein ExbD
MKKFDGINIIPFVDIMLVLLAIILTTSTLVEKKLLPVSLPSANNSTKELKNKTITFTITKKGELFFENSLINKKELEKKIVTLPKESEVTINCDKNATFDSFVYLLDKLKGAGLENIAIVTKEHD